MSKFTEAGRRNISLSFRERFDERKIVKDAAKMQIFQLFETGKKPQSISDSDLALILKTKPAAVKSAMQRMFSLSRTEALDHFYEQWQQEQKSKS